MTRESKSLVLGELFSRLVLRSEEEVFAAIASPLMPMNRAAACMSFPAEALQLTVEHPGEEDQKTSEDDHETSGASHGKFGIDNIDQSRLRINIFPLCGLRLSRHEADELVVEWGGFEYSVEVVMRSM